MCICGLTESFSLLFSYTFMASSCTLTTPYGGGRDGGDRESRGMGSGREELIEALLLTALTCTSI